MAAHSVVTILPAALLTEAPSVMHTETWSDPTFSICASHSPATYGAVLDSPAFTGSRLDPVQSVYTRHDREI